MNLSKFFEIFNTSHQQIRALLIIYSLVGIASCASIGLLNSTINFAIMPPLWLSFGVLLAVLTQKPQDPVVADIPDICAIGFRWFVVPYAIFMSVYGLAANLSFEWMLLRTFMGALIAGLSFVASWIAMQTFAHPAITELLQILSANTKNASSGQRVSQE